MSNISVNSRAIASAKSAIVVTSIAAPNQVLEPIAKDSLERDIPFYVIGDTKRHPDFSLELKPGIDAIPENMKLCYEALVANKWVGEQKLPLLDAWTADLVAIKKGTAR